MVWGKFFWAKKGKKLKGPEKPFPKKKKNLLGSKKVFGFFFGGNRKKNWPH